MASSIKRTQLRYGVGEMKDYDLGWSIRNQVSSQFIERHKHELTKPLSRKGQDKLAIQLGKQLLHDQEFFTLIYGGAVSVMLVVGNFSMVDNLAVLYQFLAIMVMLCVAVLWLDSASARHIAPIMLRVFRRHYLMQLKKQSVLSKISEDFIHQHFKDLDKAEFKALKSKLCFSVKSDSQKFSAVYFLILKILILIGGVMLNEHYHLMVEFFIITISFYLPVFFMGKLINERMGIFILKFFKGRYLDILNYDFHQQ